MIVTDIAQMSCICWVVRIETLYRKQRTSKLHWF